ncbi:uncharacterized protein BXZ73DRAFT_78316 [Epithele typhae]|uniref:uncharacterized protein n=1 Tax=Epithele typhae TaxID=378194 RepID=UPI002007B96F|nr:uncharacterized protein BXZ73DRAFT_78316 [Epithele typhae]KAH9928500.1 hypothetical protein BXZ73DRAFT_78316 [Epithele typhae]
MASVVQHPLSAAERTLPDAVHPVTDVLRPGSRASSATIPPLDSSPLPLAPTTSHAPTGPHNNLPTHLPSPTATNPSLWERLPEVLGFTGRDEYPRHRRQELVYTVVSTVFNVAQAPDASLGSFQVVVILTLTILAAQPRPAGHANTALSERDACSEMYGLDIFWLARLLPRCVTLWVIFWHNGPRRVPPLPDAVLAPPTSTTTPPHPLAPMNATRPARRGTSETTQSEAVDFLPGAFAYDASQICPLTSSSRVCLFWHKIVDPVLIFIWLFLYVSFVVQHARFCHRHALMVAGLTDAILTVISITLLLRAAIWFLRRTRIAAAQPAPRPDRLSKAEVDLIPLVFYAPQEPSGGTKVTTHSPSPHSYPPAKPFGGHRFALFRPCHTRMTSKDSDLESGEAATMEYVLRSWKPGEIPFVTLDTNHDTCSICREEYQAPARGVQMASKPNQPSAGTENQGAVHEATSSQDGASDGGCCDCWDVATHSTPTEFTVVMQKACIDRWLLDECGRCPLCGAAVEVAPPHKKRW